MKVLVIGSGGREHAIAWKLSLSKKIDKLFCAPGNPGTQEMCENVQIAVDDIDNLVKFAKENQIDLTVIGPEYPLTLGIVDEFKKEGLRVFGPTKAAAQIEGSKSFSKEIMDAAGVPTAKYKSVSNKSDLEKVLAELGSPIVIKNDGLAAGKGVFVCLNDQQVKEAVEILYKTQKPERVVVESFLPGKEVSFMAACAGEVVVPLATSHDYKRIFDDDQGPNTGGMGTVSPTPNLNNEQEEWVLQNVMKPVVNVMNERGCAFTGFLYAGLIVSPTGEINVLEFNARLGDPETESIMRRLESDFFDLLYSLSSDHPADVGEVKWSNKVASCIIMASEGYPESSSKGDEITGIELAEKDSKVKVFHAGTGVSNGSLVTNGGRVLAVTALDENLETSLKTAYEAVSKISFRACQYRSDIGK